MYNLFEINVHDCSMMNGQCLLIGFQFTRRRKKGKKGKRMEPSFNVGLPRSIEM